MLVVIKESRHCLTLMSELKTHLENVNDVEIAIDFLQRLLPQY